jgi:transposase
LRQIAKDFGISEACLHRWLKIADREDSVDRIGSPVARDESAELREARKRIKLLEQEAEVMRRAVGYLSRHYYRRFYGWCQAMVAWSCRNIERQT